MRGVLVIIIVVHGLIHLMGFAKAFGLGDMSQLTKPIRRPVGLAWLVCCVAFLATAVLAWWMPQVRWWAGLPAVLLSQGLIVSSWRDAKFGTVVNVVILVALIL